MKRLLIPFFSFLLVFTLMLGSFGSAKAAADDAPVVTPVSGDMDFSTSVVSTGLLPGTTQFNLMPVPVGFPAGEAQYGGDGILVTKMDYGKASACFSIATAAINQGWGGKVGVWNGTKWVLLATTINPQEDSATSLACAAINGNGTYAFIKWIADASLLPKSTLLPKCTFEAYSAFTIGLPVSLGIILITPVPDGTPVSYTVLSQNLPGSLDGPLTGSTTTSGNQAFFPVTYDDSPQMNSAVIRVTLQGCYKDVTYVVIHKQIVN